MIRLLSITLSLGCCALLAAGSCLAADEVVLSDSAASAPSAETYFRDRQAGWFWYRDPPPEVKEPKPKPMPIPLAKPPVPREVAAHNALKKEFNEALVVAMMNPTPENMFRYASVQTRLVKLSDTMSDVFQRTVWSNPQFDFTLQRPVNSVGLRGYEQEKSTKRAEVMERLSQTHIFYYFFRGDCPYCQAFSPVLARFSEVTGIRVFPISVDGGASPQFPNARSDNGMGRTLKVTSVPALFLADPNAGTIAPIGFGALAENELFDRVMAVANPPSDSAARATPIIPFTGE